LYSETLNQEAKTPMQPDDDDGSNTGRTHSNPLSMGKNTPLDEASEEELALRWRNAILRLTEDFSDAAGQRDDLSPILMGALHNALERLLVRGEEDDLILLEEWLREGGESAAARPAIAPLWPGVERRANADRRRQQERRTGRERRIT
jgi:hypothetical protein